jgi:DNA invertase Pin-like site-specific DNA recombinase
LVFGEYSDETFSAFRSSRGPGLVDAMQHAEELALEHGASELWAQHSDRLARGDGRRARHAVEVALWALKREVSVCTVQDPDTFRDLLYAVVMGQRNHEDSRRKGLAMAAGRRRAAARGEFIGYRPDGYKLAINLSDTGQIRKQMVIDPDRQEVIETIFRLALRRLSTGKIARALNDAGWLTNPSRRGITRRRWTTEHVDQILRNPRYAGLAVFGGEVVARGHWPTYITEREHERIRARMAKHAANTKPVRHETYLLKGLLECGRCGQPIYCSTSPRRKDGSHSRRYICASHEKDRDAKRCQTMPINADMLEAMLIASLRALLPDSQDDELAQTGSPTPVLDIAWERQQLLAGALSDDTHFQTALERLLDRASPRHRDDVPSQRRTRQLATLTRFEAWAAEELTGRTPTSRAAVQELNRLLSIWFSKITVLVEDIRVLVTATERFTSGDEPLPQRHATVSLDRIDWTRIACHVGRHRLRFGSWDDPEILGALQAWSEHHKRSPTAMDWAIGDTHHPNAKTVRRHFGHWTDALQLAGLKPYDPPTMPRNHPWSDHQVIDALRKWSARHGRPPKWHEWRTATPNRPCCQTVCRHFGGWPAGLTAAGL